MIPAPDLESAIFSRSVGFFLWERVFQDYSLVARGISRPFQYSEHIERDEKLMISY